MNFEHRTSNIQLTTPPTNNPNPLAFRDGITGAKTIGSTVRKYLYKNYFITS